MTCNVCNQFLEVDERKIPCKIVVDYDCGYAVQWIENINYCPMCGRKLNNE